MDDRRNHRDDRHEEQIFERLSSSETAYSGLSKELKLFQDDVRAALNEIKISVIN